MGNIVNKYFWIPASGSVSRNAQNEVIEKLIVPEVDLTLAIFSQENGYLDRDNFRFASRIQIDEDELAIFTGKWTEMTEADYYTLRGKLPPT